MKKLNKLLLFVILLCPILIFTACVSPQTYLITSSSSESSWGRISGGTSEKMEEGSSITLTAIETSSENHPFICWIKDYKTYYSSEKSINLVYNQESQGHYTAIYKDDPSKMLFATLSNISVETSIYTKIAFTLNASSSATGSNNYTEFTKGEFTPTSLYTSDYKSILYFGSLGSTNEYKFQINLTLTKAQGEETNKTITFSQKINKTDFGANSTYQISETIENAKINLTFEKLSYLMYHTIYE